MFFFMLAEKIIGSCSTYAIEPFDKNVPEK
jgi:hypothetical protein